MKIATDETENASRSTTLAIAFTWVFGFLVFYLTRPLGNNARSTRLDLWKETPSGFLDAVLVLGYGKPGETRIPAGWQFLGQRVEIWLPAAFVWLSAWSIGSLLLRRLDRPGNRLAIDSCERLVFTCGVGVSVLSLITLLVGLLGQLSQVGVAMLGGIAVTCELLDRWRSREKNKPASLPKTKTANPSAHGRREIDPQTLRRGLVLVALAPFVILMIWGAALPSTIFDVKEYHLQGPKEWYLTGQITFLDHNVYTAFPFLTEMLSLFSMTLRGDWFFGSLIGKTVLMGFVPLTGLACFASARRWCGEVAGWAAAFVYLTIPWTTTMATTAYVEGGLSFFVVVTVHSALLATRQLDMRLVLLTGLLAGSAMACKYPALISVVVPVGFGLIYGFSRKHESTPRLQRTLRACGLFALGVTLTVGPWLFKNAIQTGNPVYPLAWNVFGGEFWDAEREAQWTAAHSPPEHDIGKLFIFENGQTGWLLQPIVGSDGLSVLLFALAPLAFLRLYRTSADRSFHAVLVALSLYSAWFIFSWWAFTHRIDRFWMPMLPVVAVLAGIGWTWSEQTVWKVTVGFLAVMTWGHHLALAPHYGTQLPYLGELNAARRDAARLTAGSIQFINDRISRGELPAESIVLSVGDAEVFDAQFPIRYETVFNNSIFAACVFEPSSEASTSPALRQPAKIRQLLREQGVTHIMVEWSEILRYRATYGYNTAITPTVFDTLRTAGVIGPPQAIQHAPWFQLVDARRQQVTELGWEKQLVVSSEFGPLMIQSQIYTVR